MQKISDMASPFETMTMEQRLEKRRQAQLRRERWPREDFQHKELFQYATALAHCRAELEDIVVRLGGEAVVMEGKEGQLQSMRLAIAENERVYNMLEIRAKYGDGVAEKFKEETTDMPDLTQDEEKKLMEAIKQHKGAQKLSNRSSSSKSKPYDREEEGGFRWEEGGYRRSGGGATRYMGTGNGGGSNARGGAANWQVQWW
jgi:hypothetical protein